MYTLLQHKLSFLPFNLKCFLNSLLFTAILHHFKIISKSKQKLAQSSSTLFFKLLEMPVETRNTRTRDRTEQVNDRLRSRRRVDSNVNINEHETTSSNNDNNSEEDSFPTRRRRNRSQPRETGYQARGYRTRHLSAGDRNQMYLQEGIPEVAREYVSYTKCS